MRSEAQGRRPSAAAMRSEAHGRRPSAAAMRSDAQGRRACRWGGERGAGLRKWKDSAEVPVVVVVVVNAHPPRTPHDHMERINRPFADDQLDLTIVRVLRRMLSFFPCTTRSCTPLLPQVNWQNTRWRIGCDCAGLLLLGPLQPVRTR
jgi:hypothetical protein